MQPNLTQLPMVTVAYNCVPTQYPVNNPQDAEAALRLIISQEAYVQQCIYVLFLNQNREVLCWRHLNTGTAEAVTIDVKLLLTIACGTLADSIIIAHTMPHCSDAATPEMLNFIETFTTTTKLTGITLIDYIIVNAKKVHSIGADDLWPTDMGGY